MDFEKIYKQLGIPVEPLPLEYNPDQYAKELMRQCRSPEGVVYASATTYTKETVEVMQKIPK